MPPMWKLGHFKKVNPKVNSVEEGHFLGAVRPMDGRAIVEWKTHQFKMDTGADMTVISNELFSSLN